MAKIKILDEKKLRKKYASNRATVIEDEDPLWLPSEHLPVNWQLGGGIPYGKLLEIFGYESVGKSLLAMAFAKTTQKLGGIVIWADAESSWNNHWAKQNGVDPAGVELYVENSVERISDWARDMCYFHRSKLVNNEPILLVLDSLAALEILANSDKEMTDSKAAMGNRAKAIYEMWRVRAPLFYKLGICVIAINQLREKIGASMFEESSKTVGGASTQFYASQRVALIRSTQIKNGEGKDSIKIGQNIIVDIKKNKVAPPSPRIKTEVYFKPNGYGEVGYSKYAGIFDVLIHDKVIERKGTTITFEGKVIARGEASFVKLFSTDKKLRASILEKSSIHTVSKARTRLDTLSHNIYDLGNIKGDSDTEEDEE